MLLFGLFLFLLELVGATTSSSSFWTTSSQWLLISNTSIFWPTSTNYLYGPTTGPNAAVVTCNAEWIEYRGRQTGMQSLGSTGQTTSYATWDTSDGACRTSVSLEDWSDTHRGPTTTLCDGMPRALGPRETVTAYYPGTGPCHTWNLTTSYVSDAFRTVPYAAPDCQLNSQTEACSAIWQTYSSLSSQYEATITTLIPGDIKSPIRPADCPEPIRTYPEENPCSNCHFLPGTATLFYWPVTTIDGDLCTATDGTTLTPTPTASGPNTALVDGHVFVSPTVYVSFTTIYAWSNRRGHAGFQCGVSHSNDIISVDPATLSSMRHHRNARYPTIGTAYPFNFADFNLQTIKGTGNYTQALVPWPQYRGGSQCPPSNPSCSMIRDDYMPWLLMPKEVRGIDAGWSVCDSDWYIPPLTMVPLVDGKAQYPATQAERWAVNAAAMVTQAAAASVDPAWQEAIPQEALTAHVPRATSNGHGRG